MDWQATGDSWPGGQPDQDPGLPPLPARLPGPAARRLRSRRPVGRGRAVRRTRGRAGARRGPDDLYAGADTDALVGIARQWAAVESWAAAGKLAALRAMTREDAEGRPLLRRRSDLPDGWDDNLTYEISGALAMGPVSAGNLAYLAWTLGTRLAGIGRLLAAGTLTLPKARLIAQLFEPAGRRRGGAGRGADPGRAGRQDLPPGGAPRLAGRPGGGPGHRRAGPDGGGEAGAGDGVP